MNLEKLKEKNKILQKAAATLDTEPEQLPNTIRKLKKEIEEFKAKTKGMK